MRVKLLHKLGALILTAAVFSGVAMLGTSTAQARKGVVVVPRVYIGNHHHHRHWRHHRHHGRW
jgi:hypothetical protein